MSFSYQSVKELVMSHMKNLAIDIQEGLGNNLHVHPTVYEVLRKSILNAHPYEVHILLCNNRIIGVYANKPTAEYEMHLCIQGDSHEGQPTQDYMLLTSTVNTEFV
tara:strand:+ start:376 stop:693 length:318 start_codon:yes stop_codon:yes gene_type:complete